MAEEETQKRQKKIIGEPPKINTKRNVKDSVFTNLFGTPKYLFKMYQALHPEDTETKIIPRL